MAKRGKEKVYTQDVEAMVNAGAKLIDVTLEKKGKDGKTYTQPSKSVKLSSVSQFLAFCGNSDDEVLKLIENRIVNPMIQANDYRKLTVAAEGPEKQILDTVAALLDNKMFDTKEEALEFAITRLQKSGVLPASFEYEGVTYGEAAA